MAAMSVSRFGREKIAAAMCMTRAQVGMKSKMGKEAHFDPLLAGFERMSCSASSTMNDFKKLGR